MIPQRLVLKNFLSYREATLNFQGLHTACICGANGAGKSSLLEAIAWAIWGESRVTSEDDVIHLGAEEAQVDFIFSSNQHLYRILRSRQRGQGTFLEFQIACEGEPKKGKGKSKKSSNETPWQFRSLTAKGIRATQHVILEHLKLDYETFTNSAYLRQGRADEFMLKRPGERKQILADLLKLTQYDELADRARDQSRQLKGKIELLERSLAGIEEELQQRQAIAMEQTALEQALEQMQQEQAADTEQLTLLSTNQHQRATWQQQLTWQHQQRSSLEQDCQRLQRELSTAHSQLQALEEVLGQEGTITAGYAHLQTLQTEEEQFSHKFAVHQLAQTRRQDYHQQQREQLTQLQTQLQQTQAQFEALQQQEQELHQILSKAPAVEEGLKALHQARSQLSQLDQLQLQAVPLLQRRQQLQAQVDRSHTRLAARLEELSALTGRLQQQQEKQPSLQQAVLEVSDRIETLEQRRAYQQRVREKGLERRSFMEHLQADQRNYEMQLAEIDQKIQLLKQDVVQPYPPCPLCDRPLDEHHWNLVMEKNQAKHQEILEQIWVIREQLAVSEREIQILRQEYRDLDKEMAQYASVLERRGQLQEQLQTVVGTQRTLQQLTTEVAEIEQTLQGRNYDSDTQEELQLLDRRLQQLNYDEKNHALARGEVDRWRWAEIKQAEIKQALRRQAQLCQRQPELLAQITHQQAHIQQLTAETTHHLATLDQHIADIGYSLEQHNALRQALRQAQSWQLRYQELCQARQQYPLVQQRIDALNQSLQERQQSLHTLQGQTEALARQLQQMPDCQAHIHALEQRLQQRRLELDGQLASLGRLQQQLQHLETLDRQQASLSEQLQIARRQHRVYQELALAFGKNGIQALMIENVLPQLEAETNRILGRLSINQLHIQFITQRSNRRDQARSPKSKAQTAKLIETLDILIADAHGTRPYETYSGGEAFRVNFSIRLALAKLLAQRSGTALQMLIVDEGFGTQDAEGCDRLIAAINAIAPDFACILTVTHVPHFKEAFQSRIEVFKTDQGSQLELVI